jgi:hypothetical protein
MVYVWTIVIVPLVLRLVLPWPITIYCGNHVWFTTITNQHHQNLRSIGNAGGNVEIEVEED